MMQQVKLPGRVGLAAGALFMLAVVFLFQRENVAGYIITSMGFSKESVHPWFFFVANKTIRLLLNDFACVLLIWAIFMEKKYLVLAFYVFLFEIVIMLPVYFIVKLNLEGDSEISSPLLSQIHRMIVNPTLMLLLIASLFYQRFKTRKVRQ